jgi:osmotically-inducible protein OsmY
MLSIVPFWGVGKVSSMDRSDESTKIDIVELLSRDSRVNSARITVTVVGGRVILGGDTPTLYTRAVAEDLCTSVRGVRDVKNELRVSPPSASPSDDDIRCFADQVLNWNASIDDSKINVNVCSGSLTLEGEVDAYWKRDHIEELILDIQGITHVDNRLVVNPDLIPQDQVIADDVRSAIDRYTRLGDDTIRVDVNDGIVTLTGNVPNWYSKFRTPRVAEHVLGVKDIVNNLDIITQPAQTETMVSGRSQAKA